MPTTDRLSYHWVTSDGSAVSMSVRRGTSTAWADAQAELDRAAKHIRECIQRAIDDAED